MNVHDFAAKVKTLVAAGCDAMAALDVLSGMVERHATPVTTPATTAPVERSAAPVQPALPMSFKVRRPTYREPMKAPKHGCRKAVYDAYWNGAHTVEAMAAMIGPRYTEAEIARTVTDLIRFRLIGDRANGPTSDAPVETHEPKQQIERIADALRSGPKTPDELAKLVPSKGKNPWQSMSAQCGNLVAAGRATKSGVGRNATYTLVRGAS